MSIATDLVNEVRAEGGELIALDNGKLRIKAPAPLAERLMGRLKQEKAGVVSFLAHRNRLLSGWDSEMARLIEWFLTIEPPTRPFDLCKGVTVARPALWWVAIQQDIAEGPSDPRAYTGALQADLRKLWSYFNEEGIQTRGTA